MNSTYTVFSLLLIQTCISQLPYIGGNDPNFLINNPNEIGDLLKDIKGKVPEACKVIPGIGLAVLSLRQYQQAIESHFDSNSRDSFVKIVYFKEFANPTTKQLIYKTVFYIKTFTSNIFIGIEVLYKPQGYPSFEVLSYIMDSDIENVKLVLNDTNIDINDIFACGDLQEIFRQKQNIQIVTDTQQQQYRQEQSQQSNQIYYGGNPRDIKPDPLQPYNLASTRTIDANSEDPKYLGVDN